MQPKMFCDTVSGSQLEVFEGCYLHCYSGSADFLKVNLIILQEVSKVSDEQLRVLQGLCALFGSEAISTESMCLWDGTRT